MRGKSNIFHAIMAALILTAWAVRAEAQENFVTGLEGGFTFSAAQCGSAGRTVSFMVSGKTFKIITFYYDGSAVTAVEDAGGKRAILFRNGRPGMRVPDGKDYQPVGFLDGKELQTNEYAIGPHDFTGDGQPEIVIAVRPVSGCGTAVHVFRYDWGWKCIGEMALAGVNVRSCRVFRQTVTIKEADTGILHTWTWHDGKFDFLSSGGGH